MKSKIMSALFLLTSFVSAQDLVLVEDGSRVKCSTQRDVNNNKSKLIFSLKKPTIYIEENDNIDIYLDVYFYECREVSESKFKLVEVDFKSKHEFKSFTGEVGAVEYNDAKLRAYNNSFKSIDTARLGEVVGLRINKADLDVNNFPDLQYKGEYYINFDISMLKKITSQNYDSGSTLTNTGSFRLFFDLDDAEVTF